MPTDSVITLQAELTKVSTLADGTVRLQFDCQEDKTKTAEMLKNIMSYGELKYKVLGEP